jgi:hypothetical protein
MKKHSSNKSGVHDSFAPNFNFDEHSLEGPREPVPLSDKSKGKGTQGVGRHGSQRGAREANESLQTPSIQQRPGRHVPAEKKAPQPLLPAVDETPATPTQLPSLKPLRSWKAKYNLVGDEAALNDPERKENWSR